jgi:H+/Cl- antiporter ClcA
MKHDPDITAALRHEFSDWRPWVTRAVVLTYAAAAGLAVVAFTWMSERAFDLFQHLREPLGWGLLLWMPALTALIVWLTRRFAPGAAGSGIPQVMAALDTSVDASQRHVFVSLKLAVAKLLLTPVGLLAGLSLGREGPSVQVAAGVLHNARRWLPERSTVTDHGLLTAGGAAGIAAAFNTPLGGIMFAIEELSRSPEQRSSGLLMSAIVLAGLMAVSVYGNATYFGIIQVQSLDWSLLVPGLLLAVGTGALGGLFARLLIASAGSGLDRLSRWRRQRPVAFAAGCGLVIAVIGLASGGSTLGSGYVQTRGLLEGHDGTPGLYVLLKFIATWLTTWSGVPAGVFAPSLAIGAGMGSDMAALFGHPDTPTLIALGMAGFLAAVTQAPLTAFIIVMEMVAGHTMVLSLIACSLIASLVSRIVSPPLYGSLAQLQLQRIAPVVAPVVEPQMELPLTSSEADKKTEPPERL